MRHLVESPRTLELLISRTSCEEPGATFRSGLETIAGKAAWLSTPPSYLAQRLIAWVSCVLLTAVARGGGRREDKVRAEHEAEERFSSPAVNNRA
jgi:hypothetical protein